MPRINFFLWGKGVGGFGKHALSIVTALIVLKELKCGVRLKEAVFFRCPFGRGRGLSMGVAFAASLNATCLV